MFSLTFPLIDFSTKKFMHRDGFFITYKFKFYPVIPRIPFIIFFCWRCIFYSQIVSAQNALPDIAVEKKDITSEQSLFNNDTILHFKLAGKLRELFRDRDDNAVYHPMLLQYKNNDNGLISIPLKIKTRGNFRRNPENCFMPPLLLNFPKKDILKSTVFEKQDKLKLVVPCGDDDYVIKEYLVYKLYNLLTEKSFRARLVLVEFEDSLKRRKTETHYGILLEDENEVAKRNGCFLLNRKMIPAENIDKSEFTKMAVFQFMIGNTDWSVPYLHNIRLMCKDSASVPCTVPYDFDYAGIVNTRYAIPTPELGIVSVQQRLYRGYCLADKKELDEIFTLFNNLKNDFYNVYINCSLLNPKYVKTTLNYLDDFYKIINNKKTIDTQFGAPCGAQGKVVIKGLKE